MFEIISNTPVYVWPLLAYLFWGGWKSRKAYIVPWKTLFIMPAVMLVWSVYSILTQYSSISICFWAISITLGAWIGLLTTRSQKLKFNKQQQLIEVSGSWTPMILSMSIFVLRYFLEAANEMLPELVGSPTLFIIENIATVVSGMFIGRLIGYGQRYKTSPHTDLVQI